jgi:hypothetical protein
MLSLIRGWTGLVESRHASNIQTSPRSRPERVSRNDLDTLASSSVCWRRQPATVTLIVHVEIVIYSSDSRESIGQTHPREWFATQLDDATGTHPPRTRR